MRVCVIIALTFVAGSTLTVPSEAQTTPAPVASEKAKPQADPNQRICEDITVVGSRLGKKRICATRAEWEAKKRDDREAVDRAQTQVCVINPATGKC